MKKLTVSVGIPAFNEGANIKQLLFSMISQNEVNFTLKEIIVVSDCSIDNTVNEIKSIESKKISLLQNRKRIGQALTQNRIIEKFDGDILVLLNGDVLPFDNNFISSIIKPFQNSKNIGIVCPKMIPAESNSFFGKMNSFGASCKWKIFESWNRTNILLCSGAARAFSKDLAKQIQWPKVMGEDAYSFFYCITKGYKFIYQPSAKLLYKPADNFSDQRKQSSRFIVSREEMTTLFPEELVKENYNVPLHLKIISTLQYFLKNPIFMGCYLLYFLFANINPQKEKFRSAIWEVSKSSKTLSRA